MPAPEERYESYQYWPVCQVFSCGWGRGKPSGRTSQERLAEDLAMEHSRRTGHEVAIISYGRRVVQFLG